MSTIKADDFMAEINAAFQDFMQATAEIVDQAGQDAADKAITLLQNSSPEKTGDYRKGWAKKTLKRALKGGYGSVVVWNATDYRLTHLLEEGHRKVVWGHRKEGRVEAKPHIAQAEDAAVDLYLRRIREGVPRGKK